MVSEGLERAGVPEIGEEVDKWLSRLDRGSYWGSKVFAERLLKLGKSILNRKRHPNYRGSQEAKAHGELDAGRLMEEGLNLAGISKEAFEELPGSDLHKVALAELIARRTTVGMGWISRALKCAARRMSASKSGDFGMQKSSILQRRSKKLTGQMENLAQTVKYFSLAPNPES